MGYNSGIKVFIFLFITKEKPTYCIIFLNNLYLYREFECKKMRFDELDLEDAVLDGLYDMNFDETTPVQELTIPVILEGKDIIACAQTGTGKTAAYVLPVINELSKGCHPTDAVNAVIMAPTRELAQQIDQQIQGFTYFIPSVSAVAVYGGTDGIAWEQQKRGLEMGADIVIATPGRLLSEIVGIQLTHHSAPVALRILQGSVCLQICYIEVGGKHTCTLEERNLCNLTWLNVVSSTRHTIYQDEITSVVGIHTPERIAIPDGT